MIQRCAQFGFFLKWSGTSYVYQAVFYITEKSGQKCKYLKNEESF